MDRPKFALKSFSLGKAGRRALRLLSAKTAVSKKWLQTVCS
jgi:hypothetical protein